MRCKACDTVWLVSGPELKVAVSDETGERRAAVVKRGTKREKRDLFAARPMDVGSVRQTLRPPPPQSITQGNDDNGGVGARNESSVLFTVDALARTGHTAAMSPRMPTPEPAPMSAGLMNAPVDDDGIIDLAALSSHPPRYHGAVVPSLFPSEPPPGAFARDADQSAGFAAGRASNRKKLIAFGSISAAVALAVVGLVLLFKGPVPAPVSAAMPPLAAVEAPAPKTMEPSGVTTTTSSDDGATSNDDSTDAKGAHKKGGHKGGKGGKGTKLSSGGGGAAAAAPKSVAASDPCHCHGDFTCALRCSAKGK